MLAAATGLGHCAQLVAQANGNQAERDGCDSGDEQRGDKLERWHAYNLSVSSESALSKGLNAFANSFTRHWLALIVAFLFVYSLLPFGAPILKKAGFETAAQFIYQPYKFLCHTYGFRSLFLFGDQVFYARPAFESASGINTTTFSGLIEARNFQGSPQMGYKVALCERDVAIYLAMALNGIAFALVRKRAKPMPWWLFILIGLAPIGIDGFSQLLSQPPFALFPYRESTLPLRLLTGSLFGFSVAWLVFPIIQGTMSQD